MNFSRSGRSSRTTYDDRISTDRISAVPSRTSGSRVLLLALGLFLSFASAEPRAASASSRPVKLTPRSVLKSVWQGQAKVEKGKSQGQVWQWAIEFPNGDFSSVKGSVVSEVVKVEAKRFSLKRPFKMKIVYTPGPGLTYEVLTTTQLDPTATKMTGTFQNIMGSGTFELVKKQTSPPKSSLKGTWAGELTSKRGSLAKTPLPLSIAAVTGQFEFAQVILGDYKVLDFTPSAFDEKTRGAVFFVRYSTEKESSPSSSRSKKKGRLLQISGTFSEDYRTFQGTFEDRKLGSGSLELKKEA